MTVVISFLRFMTSLALGSWIGFNTRHSVPPFELALDPCWIPPTCEYNICRLWVQHFNISTCPLPECDHLNKGLLLAYAFECLISTR